MNTRIISKKVSKYVVSSGPWDRKMPLKGIFFDFIFEGIVRIDKLHNSVEVICLLKNGFYGNGKRHYFSYQSKSCPKDKIVNQKHESYTFKLLLIKLIWLDKC